MKTCLQLMCSSASEAFDEEWTTFTQSADTRKVYVSSSTGSSGNTGLTEGSPKQTLIQGLALLRDGFPDWLLLKAGDVWTNEQFGYISGGNKKSGRSASEPMLFSSYGSGARPLIKVTTNQPGIGSVGGAGNGGNYLAIVGLEFYAHTRDPASGTYNAGTLTQTTFGTHFFNPISWMLIEDCKFSFFNTNIVMQGGAGAMNNISLRRNIIHDAFSINSHAHSQGMYLEGTTGLLLEENLIDHNGWNGTVADAGRTQFNHGLYHSAAANGPVTLVGNIFSRNSNHGSMANKGGTVTNNFYVRNAIGFLIKNRQDGGTSTAIGNVVMESEDRVPGDNGSMGWGINTDDSGPVDSDITITNNIVAHEGSAGTNQNGIQLDSLPSGTITCTGNIIYDWPNPVVDYGSNVSTPNDIDLNPPYVDPNRSIATYNASLGGSATLSGFLAEVYLQSRSNWRAAYTADAVNAYIRAGFAV